mmetsp:Transcript_55085/g.103277  ORF Transcript_55085/g.103277 Transcript_55085/m.103277 type:complete len:463 (+) Transcript_55085:48-1436(+)
MGGSTSKPEIEHAQKLQAGLEECCFHAAQLLQKADVLLFCNGAGWSADSGLAVYADVAKVAAYSSRGLEYHDICRPKWVFDEPELFWGFWGQCFNDYRLTQPHEGYSIVRHWTNCLFRDSDVATSLRARISSAEIAAIEEGVDDSPYPYEVSGQAGAFFVHTSNVDAHHFDVFEACEIRECHGNVELYQCAGGKPERGLKGREPCQDIWRAPKQYSFYVDKTTMLAPEVVPEGFDPALAETNHWAAEDEGRAPANGTAKPAIGRVQGGARQETLRNMREISLELSGLASGFSKNHPVCPNCRGPARPAILMFGDGAWLDLESQQERCDRWEKTVGEMARERANSPDPLRIIILEVGAGDNVRTIRVHSEERLKDWLRSGADAKLLRVNPDFPLPDDRELNDEGDLAGHVISMMGKGLHCIKMMDNYMGPASRGRPPAPSCAPPGPPATHGPPPAMAPPAPPP